MREAPEIAKHPNNLNGDVGTGINEIWRQVIHKLRNGNLGISDHHQALNF